MKKLRTLTELEETKLTAAVDVAHKYFTETNWTWWDSDKPPTKERIREVYLDLAANANSWITSGGLAVINVKDDENTADSEYKWLIEPRSVSDESSL